MSATKNNSRELLQGIGIGDFNATMIVPYMMIAPATTDPKAPQIILLVQHLQRALYGMGATDVPNSGRLDAPTARALEQLVGPNWERMSWSASVSAVVAARRAGYRFEPNMRGAIDDGMPVSVGGPLDFLPDVPGGLLTYAIGGFLLYRHFSKR